MKDIDVFSDIPDQVEYSFYVDWKDDSKIKFKYQYHEGVVLYIYDYIITINFLRNNEINDIINDSFFNSICNGYIDVNKQDLIKKWNTDICPYIVAKAAEY